MKTEKAIILVGAIAAINSAGIGVALFLQCGFGNDPIAALCQGMQNRLGISFGNASVLLYFLIIGIAIGIARKNLGI